MTTYTVLLERPATSSPGHMTVDSAGAISNSARPVLQVPESQLYYWRRAWQANERLAAAELACGEGVEFDDADDAVRWLLAD